MEHYGNILPLYNSNNTQLNAVRKMINDRSFPFELVENTFFFGTSSIKKSKDFQKELALLSLDYTFFFLSNADGSTIKAKGIDEAVVQHIGDIFFNDI